MLPTIPVGGHYLRFRDGTTLTPGAPLVGFAGRYQTDWFGFGGSIAVVGLGASARKPEHDWSFQLSMPQGEFFVSFPLGPRSPVALEAAVEGGIAPKNRWSFWGLAKGHLNWDILGVKEDNAGVELAAGIEYAGYKVDFDDEGGAKEGSSLLFGGRANVVLPGEKTRIVLGGGYYRGQGGAYDIVWTVGLRDYPSLSGSRWFDSMPGGGRETWASWQSGATGALFSMLLPVIPVGGHYLKFRDGTTVLPFVSLFGYAGRFQTDWFGIGGSVAGMGLGIMKRTPDHGWSFRMITPIGEVFVSVPLGPRSPVALEVAAEGLFAPIAHLSLWGMAKGHLAWDVLASRELVVLAAGVEYTGYKINFRKGDALSHDVDTRSGKALMFGGRATFAIPLGRVNLWFNSKDSAFGLGAGYYRSLDGDYDVVWHLSLREY